MMEEVVSRNRILIRGWIYISSQRLRSRDVVIS